MQGIVKSISITDLLRTFKLPKGIPLTDRNLVCLYKQQAHIYCSRLKMDSWMNDELSTSVTAKFKYTDKHIKHNILKGSRVEENT